MASQKSGSARAHQTQWAAQFAVASELCKRGYEVSFTLGHTTPLADLMAVSPGRKEMFLIDVKGLYRRNPWLIKQKEGRSNLFYILVHVPTDSPNRFFLLAQRDVTQLIKQELKRLERSEDYSVTGFVWNLALPHENAWGILPA
jgi:hypothetical protein